MYINIMLSLATLSVCFLDTQAAFFKGQLRGPNICYHYDTGRHCCPGFTQRNGLCLLMKTNKPSPQVKPSTSNPQLRFAERPDKSEVVRSTKVDGDGRGNKIAYLGGRSEETIYFTDKQTDKDEMISQPNVKTSTNKNDFYVPVDMEQVRLRLARQQKDAVTTTETVIPKPVLRFQPSPKPYRPWDDKNDRISAPYNQVAIGKSGSSYFQALKAAEVSVVREIDHRGAEYSGRDGGQAAFRRPDLVTLPLNNKPEKTTPQSSFMADAGLENRKYFKPQPITNNLSQQEVRRTDSKLSIECPESHTAVFSEEEGTLCYPTFALMESIDRAPSRGDSAFVCPPGHQPHSSVYGEACVPYDWRPCSGEVGCSHDQQQPIVNPVVVSPDCYSSYDGRSLPCRNSVNVQGCADASCGGCQSGNCDQDVAYGPNNCQGTECLSQSSNCDSAGCNDCVDGACAENIADQDCSQGGCVEVSDCGGRSCDDFSAGSGRCLNGATRLANGICLCRQGFEGSQCERRVVDWSSSVQDDVDECMESGTNGRGPCSHQCLNTIGSFKCLCPAGSIVAQDGVSCMFITCPKCMHGGHCDTDTNQCICPSGFTGDICEKDVNECEEVPGICSHECRNTFGSYACLCKPGYTLLRDGHSCEDWRCKPNCVNGGTCVRNKCICPAGFSGIICQFNNRLG